ncbi:DNA-binding protein [Aeromicrobium sp. Root344]|uniref:ribbon-helix-helix protein, CopG family n=1 Tax=Aeromicrobium sp. Root344 TaxID=1736521 RepID=UPI0006F7573F|nr:ribbon-helix-helix protein, CopG family [Aeromicrobium sp. Root344]KQV77001.1 DNA-binding protein [Aeromicrobium sp. Root344]
MKTLAIRLEDEQHARISILAKLANVSVTDAIRDAINTHIEKLAADPEVSAKAESLTAEIERDAAEQRSAIAALFGGDKPASRARQQKG